MKFPPFWVVWRKSSMYLRRRKSWFQHIYLSILVTKNMMNDNQKSPFGIQGLKIMKVMIIYVRGGNLKVIKPNRTIKFRLILWI